MGLFDFIIKKNKQSVSAPIISNTELDKQKITQEETFKDKLEKWRPPTIFPPKKIGDYSMNKKYSYKDVELKVVPSGLKFDFSMIGSEALLISEPTNEYDENAIYVSWNDNKLGYIPRNRLQDMVHDFRKKDKPIYSVISNLTIDEESETVDNVFLYIGFYTNISEDFKNCDTISSKLTKTSKKDFFGTNRQENIEFAKEGDVVTLEYSYESESYVAYLDGSELGETSAATTAKLQKFNSSDDYTGIISAVSENDTLKYTVSLNIYMK